VYNNHNTWHQSITVYWLAKHWHAVTYENNRSDYPAEFEEESSQETDEERESISGEDGSGDDIEVSGVEIIGEDEIGEGDNSDVDNMVITAAITLT